MLKSVTHIGLTVSNIETSIAFYRDVMGLKYIGSLTMEGKETDILFGRKNVKAKVAYLNAKDDVDGPSIELIQFVDEKIEHQNASLFRTSISEICFVTDDIEKDYERMKKSGVEFISTPQPFDFTKDNFSKSKALYFKDPDGIILELMEYEK